MLCDLIALILGLIVPYIKQIYKSKNSIFYKDKIKNKKFDYFIKNIDSIVGLINGSFLGLMAIKLFFNSYLRLFKFYPHLLPIIFIKDDDYSIILRNKEISLK